jgi:hypothetical protein
MTSPADEQPEHPQQGITDEQLPEDLQPTDDNPLAQPLPDDAPDPEELDVLGGRHAEQHDAQHDDGPQDQPEAQPDDAAD